MYVQKILERELYLTMTGILGFFSCRTLLVNSELPKGRGKYVHECGSHGSGASPCSLAGHAQTDAQADASHRHQGKDWRSYFFKKSGENNIYGYCAIKCMCMHVYSKYAHV